MSNLFDYINSVVYGKGNIPDSVDKSYSRFMVNRALSMHPDLVTIAQMFNESGGQPLMDDEIHWEMVRQAVYPTRRRWSWPKKLKDHEHVKMAVEAVMTFEGVDRKSAELVVSMMSDDEISDVVKDYDRYLNDKP